MSLRTIKKSLRTATFTLATAFAVTGCADVAEPVTAAESEKKKEDAAEAVGNATKILNLLKGASTAYSVLKPFLTEEGPLLTQEDLDAIADVVRDVTGEENEADERDQNIAAATSLIKRESEIFRPACISDYQAMCSGDDALTNWCNECLDAIDNMKDKADTLVEDADLLLEQMSRDNVAASTRVAYGRSLLRLGTTLVVAAHEREVAKLAVGEEIYDIDFEAAQSAAEEIEPMIETLMEAYDEYIFAHFGEIEGDYPWHSGGRRARACFDGPYGRTCHESDKFRGTRTNPAALRVVTREAEADRRDQAERYAQQMHLETFGEYVPWYLDALDEVPEIDLDIHAPSIELEDCGDNTLHVGESIGHDEQITSCNGDFILYHHSFGNVLLYGNGGASVRWASGTAQEPTAKLELRESGNLVLTDDRGRTTFWQSDSAHSDVEDARLTLTDDGELLIIDGDGQLLWSL